MTTHEFTPEERAYLESLPAVTSVRGDAIYYAPAFRDQCMERYYAGESPAAIFREAGLDPSFIGYKRIERSIARWRRPGSTAPTGVEPSHVAADHRAVRQENRALRSKVAALEGLVELANARSNQVVRKARRFELIERLRESVPDLSVSVACEALGVSEGGYYRWRSTKE